MKRNMMTQGELRKYYKCRAALRSTEETLAGLRAYAEASGEDLEWDIAELEASAKRQAEALANRETEVLSTLGAVEDASVRAYLRLHYHKGMQWKEIAAMFGKTEKSICCISYEAVKKCIPK